MKINNQLGRVVIALGIVGLSAISFSAPQVSSAVASKSPSDHLNSAPNPDFDLKTDPELQVKVSFDANHQLLSDLLMALQKGRTITLDWVQGSPVLDKRVTAHVVDMPLFEVMAGLSRLYGVTWAKKGAREFVMNASDRNELELGLLRIGDLDIFRTNFLTSIRRDPTRLDWPQAVMVYANKGTMQSAEGQSVSVLPDHLLKAIRNEKTKLAALKLIEVQQSAMEASIDEYVVRADVPPTQTQGAGNTTTPNQGGTSPRIVVYNTHGQSVAVLSKKAVPKIPDAATPPAATP